MFLLNIFFKLGQVNVKTWKLFSPNSVEFDKFLEERAISGGSRESGKARAAPRQMQKNNDDSDEMFGL